MESLLLRTPSEPIPEKGPVVKLATVNARIAAAGATSPHFQTPSGTVDAAPAQSPSDRSSSIAKWLASDVARRFDGRWVLLNDVYEAVDHDTSASELQRRHSGLVDPLIVFVQPPRVRFG